MELVRIPSMGGTDAEVEVQEHAAAMLRDLDTEVDRWDIDLDELAEDPWFPGVEVTREQAVGVVGRRPPARACRAWCSRATWTSYLPGDPDNWLGSNPFSAEIREGAMFGRGTCDMKAGAAANLAVAAHPAAPPGSGSSGRWRCTSWSARRTAGSARSRPCAAGTSARPR